jgi:hypothetical protein
MDREAAGSKDGREAVRRHGRKQLAEIGEHGFEATVRRRWSGGRDGYGQFLTNHDWENRPASPAGHEFNRRLGTGGPTASMEAPVVADPDDEPILF